MTTQLKSADGTPVANATFDFANGYATVTVEAGPNQTLTPGFHGLHIHSVGKCPREALPGTSTPLEAITRRRDTLLIPPAAT
jgi:Cu-Zn family superoxide dismutase